MSIAAGIEVLHVDDEPDFVEVAADMLEREDSQFSVETATSASEGLDRLAADDFDCVVSDYQMPSQNGIEFLEIIREEYSDLPFILFTGKGSEEVASDAISAGATDYLQKGHGTDQYGLLANRINNAVGQYRAQRRAAELDRVRTLASEINQALVRADSQSAAETQVCEIISESDPYLFAWIGDVDSDTHQIEPRASAGVEEGYLEDITVTFDDTATGHGPGGTAIRERRVAVSQNITDDVEFEPWRSKAVERGYRAVAAVPLEYQDTLYGELCVYADRPHAFDENERELLSELGSDIAHAIHSLELQETLRRERDRHQALFENAPSPVVAGAEDDTVHRIVDVNDAFEAVFGYDSEELISMDVSEAIIPDDEMAEHVEYRERVMAGETITTEVKRITTNGPREFLLHLIPYGMVGDNPEGTYAWYTDITNRKQHEQQLDRANTILRTIVENLPMGVLVEDTERNILMANDQLGETLGVPLTGEDLMGRDCDTAAEKLKDRFADSEEYISGLNERIEHQEPVYNEELRLANGRILERDYLPYNLLEGEAHLWLYRDITERQERERELQRQNEQLKQFTSVVAHDLRNPLNVAQARIELVEDEYDSEHLATAAKNIERGFDLIDDMLTLAQQGQQVSEMEPVDVASFVEMCWDNVETATATVVADIDTIIHADPNRVRQLLENLLRNAVQHGNEEVTVRVGSLPDGFYVEDDGPGIPEANRDSVFEPGYSESHDGTGFGLAIVRRIVHAHNWDVQVTEGADGGARFEFTNIETSAE